MNDLIGQNGMPKTHRLKIRRMEVDDLERVLELEQHSFPDPWTKNNFSHEVLHNESSYPYVVEANEQIIGYAVYWCFDIEAHLANFAIDQRYRRRNVGSFFLQHIIEAVREKNISDIYLEVRAANEAARNLYQKHGFVVDGTRQGYYAREKDDAILMSLSLGETQE